jgi:large subunit ribosomal protein L19e
MPNLRTQRRLAAEILKVGKDRVKFDPDRLDEIKEAITRDDIRELIKDKAIIKLPARGVKRRAGRKHDKRRKKRRRGPGSVKKKVARRKRKYVLLIRNLRRCLYDLKCKGVITKREYQKLRRMAKGGAFKDRKTMLEYIEMMKKEKTKE